MQAPGGHAHSAIATRLLLGLQIGRLANSTCPPLEEDTCEALERSCGVDSSQPIVPQVGRLGARYHDWLGWPSLSREPLLMFDSWFLETFSKTPWWTVPLLWLPLVLRSFALSLDAPPLARAAHGLLGLLAWAVVEYGLHRFVFHSRPTHPWAITLHFSLHGCHHKRPMDHLRLVFPPLFAAPIVAFFWRVCAAVASQPSHSAALFGGMLLGYVTYDCTHYLTHYVAKPSGWLSHIRAVHLAHHFVDCGSSYGVSSDLLDRVCGTRPSRSKRA